MPAPPDTPDRGARGVTVITATAGLAWERRRQFDQTQLAAAQKAGKGAWESADILPYAAWLQRTWRALSVALMPPPMLLNELQVRAIWESIIRDDIKKNDSATGALWNTHTTAKVAVDAWRTLGMWNIELDQCNPSHHHDHRRFVRWAGAYQRRCDQRNWADPYRLANGIIHLLGEARAAGSLPAQLSAQLSGQLEFAGFDLLLPQQHSLIAALKKVALKKERGIPVTVATAEQSINQTTALHVYPDEASQWLAAARWAREKLQNGPPDSSPRLAIVAPDIGEHGHAIEYALQQILCPQQLVQPALSAALPYHIALGKKLSRYPVAQAALLALSPMAANDLPRDAISGLILSPFIHGADAEAAARSKLELRCRRLPYQIPLARFLEEWSYWDARQGNHDNDHPDSPSPLCPLLRKMLTAAQESLAQDSQVKPISHWVRRFNEWLDLLGWPGERGLDSDEFQAMRAFRQQLQSLTRLDLTTPPISAATALVWLRRRMDEQPFQVEARDGPVQVLGVVGVAAQQFDGIWFGGLTETNWPPPQRPNPFIAVQVQRRAGVIAASTDHNREYAAAQQAGLIAAASEVVLAWHKQQEDIATERSSLLAEFVPFETAPAVSKDDAPDHLIHRHKPELETFIDTQGTAFQGAGAEKGAATRSAPGGIAVIENQAKCPFRAFAIHRLGARQPEPKEQGLGLAERGSLIHRALHLLWQRLESSEKLHGLRDDQLHEIIHEAATAASGRFQVASGCGDRFHETQTRWICETLQEWLDVEKRRGGAFVVAALEERATLNLKGLELTFKIDRIDRLAGDVLALFDYKTGGAAFSLQDWAGARPSSPQLPLYALAQNKPVDAIGYARVKRGKCQFVGITRQGEGAEFDQTEPSPNKMEPLAESRSLENFATFDDLLAHWNLVMPSLAQEFLDGEARVDPLNKSVCTHCDLHGFCRIAELPDDDDDLAPENTPRNT